MKRFMNLFLVLGILAAPAALACFQQGVVPALNPQKAAEEYGQNSSFSACLNKLKAKGIDTRDKDFNLYRKDREDNEKSPFSYRLRVEGKDKKGLLWHVNMAYRISKHRFECKEGATTTEKRGGCF
ncbi:hypothetical protein K2X30_02750 [bacterium]|jgi:hypothetical protein|nr:hypothetical protein [bacterium]